MMPKEEKPGFFKRLFGKLFSRKKPALLQTLPQPQPPLPPPPPQPIPVTEKPVTQAYEKKEPQRVEVSVVEEEGVAAVPRQVTTTYAARAAVQERELKEEVKKRRITKYAPEPAYVLKKPKLVIEELELDEEEKRIKALEEKLRSYRINLERELMIKREILARTEEQLRKREEIVVTKELELEQREKELEAKLAEMAVAKNELEEQIKKLQDLEARWQEWRKEREQILLQVLAKPEEPEKREVIDAEVKKLLTVLDELLAELPPEVAETFGKSENFKLYEKVLARYRIE